MWSDADNPPNQYFYKLTTHQKRNSLFVHDNYNNLQTAEWTLYDDCNKFTNAGITISLLSDMMLASMAAQRVRCFLQRRLYNSILAKHAGKVRIGTGPSGETKLWRARSEMSRLRKLSRALQQQALSRAPNLNDCNHHHWTCLLQWIGPIGQMFSNVVNNDSTCGDSGESETLKIFVAF